MFVGGTVYQAFLSALSYHRWHAPIDGTIVDVYKIPGTYYYDRSQFLTIFDESSPDLSQSFLSSTAARMVILIKA
jgi:phosphatidylserine decarboxylase